VGITLGSLPFAVWIGRFLLHKEITQFGDGNPGATNVYRASGSLWWFLLALCLDFSKAIIPVALAYHTYNIRDWRIIPIALAPTLGHSFSPFLRGRGGKALATVGGVWLALDAVYLFLPLIALTLLWSAVVQPRGWAILLALLSFSGYLVWRDFIPLPALILLAQAPFILFRQLPELRVWPTLRRLKKGV
jgi:glycerol-3-phosphate acyltransferase PlsY